MGMVDSLVEMQMRRDDAELRRLRAFNRHQLALIVREIATDEEIRAMTEYHCGCVEKKESTGRRLPPSHLTEPAKETWECATIPPAYVGAMTRPRRSPSAVSCLR